MGLLQTARVEAESITLRANYRVLLALIGDIASGEIDPRNVEIDQEAQTWKLNPGGPVRVMEPLTGERYFTETELRTELQKLDALRMAVRQKPPEEFTEADGKAVFELETAARFLRHLLSGIDARDRARADAMELVARRNQSLPETNGTTQEQAN
jgi:hypothetical protein